MKNKKPFPSDLTVLPEILSWVRLCLEETTLEEKARKQVELALEEAIVNVIKHSQARAPFFLTCNHQPERQIEFILEDTGRPFNPLSHKSTQPTLAREPGGLGIVFMKKYMDALFYRREKGRNIFTLIKKLS